MTIIIILITAITSIIAFNKPEYIYKYQLNAYQVYHRKQWYRIISHAFLHADWIHLIVNMFVLYSFGVVIEARFNEYFGGLWIYFYLILYFGSIPVSVIYSIITQKDNYNYNAIGASGGVSAIVFASILFEPLSRLLIFGLIPIPAVIFGVLYLFYSWYMGKKNIDNIGHDAHFWGAVYGFIFPILLKTELFKIFIMKIFGS